MPNFNKTLSLSLSLVLLTGLAFGVNANSLQGSEPAPCNAFLGSWEGYTASFDTVSVGFESAKNCTFEHCQLTTYSVMQFGNETLTNLQPNQTNASCTCHLTGDGIAGCDVDYNMHIFDDSVQFKMHLDYNLKTKAPVKSLTVVSLDAYFPDNPSIIVKGNNFSLHER